MDTTTLLLIIVVIIVVVLVVLYLLRRPSGPEVGGEPEVSRFEFQPADKIGGTPLVKRQVVILAPDQMVVGKTRKLVVEAMPLPPEPMQTPPKEKGIERLLTTVINPLVRYADTRETATNFDPPLTFTFSFSGEDQEAAGKTDDRPRLSIVTFYQDGEVWRWEKLPTDVDVKSMTCTAQVLTLTPRDPCGMGIP